MPEMPFYLSRRLFFGKSDNDLHALRTIPDVESQRRQARACDR